MKGSSTGAERRFTQSMAGTRRWITFLCGALWFFSAGYAHALGLGQATVNSYLNQPLEARIDLISRSEAEMATVTAGMASMADFQVIGLTRDAIGIPIEFTVNRDLADPHIRLTSSQIMTEPVLQLVVEVVWSSGRMLRQYTLFFDPPSFDAPAPLPGPSASRAPSTVPQQPVPQAPVEPVTAPQTDMAASANIPAPDAGTTGSETEPSDPSATDVPLTTDAGPPFDPLVTEPEVTPEVASTLAEPEATDTAQSPAEAVNAAELTQSEQSAEPSSEQPASKMPEELVQAAEDAPADAVQAEDARPGADESLIQPQEQEAVPMASDETLAQADITATDDSPMDAQADSAAESLPAADADRLAAASEGINSAAMDPAEQAPEEPVYRAVIPDTSVSGLAGASGEINVVRGDTLWDLSQDIAAAQNVSVNQVMLAVQQSNPQAFLDNNINRMMAGEVLRIPGRDDMLSMTVRQAMLEVMRQESLYRTRWDTPVDPNDIPTISDLAQEASPEAVSADDNAALQTSDSEVLADEASLVLVPPSERDDTLAEGMAQGSGGTNEPSEGISVVEELARTQEELVNAQQENDYLVERISELESALDQERGAADRGLQDSNLADMEDRLREDRLAAEPEPELDVTPEPAPGWLSRFGLVFVGAFLLLVGVVIWFLSSRRNKANAGRNMASGAAENSGQNMSGAGSMAGMTASPEPDTEAVETDLADPEARLDLARAYAAMGRDEKARELLESVVQDGNTTQEREAREMLREL